VKKRVKSKNYDKMQKRIKDGSLKLMKQYDSSNKYGKYKVSVYLPADPSKGKKGK
jgi:hypothetical protein